MIFEESCEHCEICNEFNCSSEDGPLFAKSKIEAVPISAKKSNTKLILLILVAVGTVCLTLYYRITNG